MEIVLAFITQGSPLPIQSIFLFISSITKNGKRTFSGTVSHKMKSLMRFFTQFTDTKKHEAINRRVKTSSFRSSYF